MHCIEKTPFSNKDRTYSPYRNIFCYNYYLKQYFHDCTRNNLCYKDNDKGYIVVLSYFEDPSLVNGHKSIFFKMKFSHLLSEFLSIDGKDHQEQAHPDFVSYKRLKKCLNKAVEEQKVWMEEYYRRQEALKKIPPRKPSPKEVEDEDTNADATTNDTRKVQTNEDIGRGNHQKNLKDREIAQPGNAIREETVIPPITEGEKEFAAILKSDVEAINRYFIEKEEDAVMRLHALNDRRCSAWTNGANAARIMQEFANFHGEMVLLLHWSMMNYGAFRDPSVSSMHSL